MRRLASFSAATRAAMQVDYEWEPRILKEHQKISEIFAKVPSQSPFNKSLYTLLMHVLSLLLVASSLADEGSLHMRLRSCTSKRCPPDDCSLPTRSRATSLLCSLFTSSVCACTWSHYSRTASALGSQATDVRHDALSCTQL